MCDNYFNYMLFAVNTYHFKIFIIEFIAIFQRFCTSNADIQYQRISIIKIKVWYLNAKNNFC